jgi:PAS domain-containing protein
MDQFGDAPRGASERDGSRDARYRALFESIDAGVCFFTRLPTPAAVGLRDYRYLAMNRAMREMFGTDLGNIQLLDERDHATLEEIFHAPLPKRGASASSGSR